MNAFRGARYLGAWLVLSVVYAARVPAQEPNVTVAGLEVPAVVDDRADVSWARGPHHEALAAPEAAPAAEEKEAERVPKAPPAAVAERPGTGPSGPGAQWIGGYWAWDKSRRDFVWVTGAWKVPPTGKFWVNGYWRRDGRGWYRVVGFWSARDDRAPERRPDWKKDGPPAPPEEDVGPVPGPNHFYVGGVYAPDAAGKELVWKPGFWYPAQPGWDWVPARWVKRSSGWSYRAGTWRRLEPGEEERDASVAAAPRYPQYNQPYYGPRYYGNPWLGRIGGFLNSVLP